MQQVTNRRKSFGRQSLLPLVNSDRRKALGVWRLSQLADLFQDGPEQHDPFSSDTNYANTSPKATRALRI